MSETPENEIRILRANFWSERDPDGRAFAPLADAYLRRGELEEARELLDDGLGRLPEFVPGHLVAARMHRARDDHGAFREAIKRLLELDPDNAAGLRLRGEAAEAEGDTDRAVDCFRRALELDPEYDDLESRIARLEVEGVPGAAEPDETALEDPADETLPEDPADETELELDDPFGLAWEDQPEPSAGGEAFETAADLDEDLSPTVTRTLGELYLRQGLAGRAVDVFEELVRRNPEDTELRERLGEIRDRVSEASPRGDDLVDDAKEGEPFADDATMDELTMEDRAIDVDLERADAAVEIDAELPDAEPSEEASRQPSGTADRSIGEYLQDLRAWEPGAIPIEALDPAAVPIESLAPESRLETRTGAAPGPEEGDGPEGDAEASGDEGEGDLDDFQDWLRGLRS